MNSAAINYYFGSKDKLLEEALMQTLNEMTKDSLATLDSPAQNIHEILRETLLYYISGMLKYPNITKAHFYDAFINNDYSLPFVREFNNCLAKLSDKITSLKPELDGEYVKVSLVQILCSVLFTGLMPNMFQEFLGSDIHDYNFQKKYIDLIIERYF